ncbi:hypothetical protein V9T40_008745 [Parthenolecanium corni]|uniref:Uncharacterized protein n=1 Tax=Parthenolecanium corni TaxID=536013 RepID=A0AAN9TYR1_9HEMI
MSASVPSFRRARAIIQSCLRAPSSNSLHTPPQPPPEYLNRTSVLLASKAPTRKSSCTCRACSSEFQPAAVLQSAAASEVLA